MNYTPRFEEALRYAAHLHASQVRKGTPIPYISHLLSVTALVIEHGGDEDQAIGALLHDAVEDQGGRAQLEIIRQQFGEQVAEIVDGCTDAYELPKAPWRKRKEDYLVHLRSVQPRVVLVSLADKVHNARSLVATLRHGGPGIWANFNGGRDGTIWYYRSLLEVFQEILPGYLTDELNHLVIELENLAMSSAE